MTIRTPQEYLLATADLIEEIGWIQGKAVQYNPDADEVEGCCIVGGIRLMGSRAMKATTDLMERIRLERFEGQARGLLYDHISEDCSLAEWNDKPGRTKEEVLALLREVAGS